MKPEVNYANLVMSSYIDDLIDELEWSMSHTSLQDPYFEELSVKKFALSKLLQAINENNMTPTAVVEKFIKIMDKSACESRNPNSDCIFSVSRDIAVSILDELHFGYSEGEKRGEFRET